LLQLIEDIIDLAKIEAGQLTINKKKFDVNDLLNTLHATFLHKKTSFYGKNIELKLNLGVNTLAFYIESDFLRTQQVISNLVDNAIKFTENGYVELGYQIENIDNKPMVRFYVKDTGIGLTKEEQQRIFNRFTKIENNKTKFYRGAGLGLAICKNIAKLLDGEISVESELNKGSTFYFSLPISNTMPKELNNRSLPMDGLENNWKGRTLLVAEDENSNFRFIEVLLKRTNVTIIRAINGKEAVELFRSNHVDLILMDIKMPVMDGLDATREIKKINKNVPIIAQTAYAMQNDENICKEAGCDDYIAKPILQDKLFSILSKYLSKV
jgi:CheY-like chemotaxis protein